MSAIDNKFQFIGPRFFMLRRNKSGLAAWNFIGL